MIKVQPTITYTGAANASAATVRQAVREEFLYLAQWWLREDFKRHFTKDAYGRYRGYYRPRTRGYEQRKRRLYGHDDPMVWTGRMRGELEASATPRGTSGGGVVHMRARALNLWGRGRKHDFRKSLTAVSPGELQKWARHVGANMPRLLAKYGGRRRKVAA